MEDEQPDLYVEKRMSNSTDADLTTGGEIASDSQRIKPLAFVVGRRPLSFVPFRRPTRYHLVAHRHEESIKNLAKL